MANQDQVKAWPEPGQGRAKAIHMGPSQEFFDPPALIKIEFVLPGKQSQDAANRGPAKAQLRPHRGPAHAIQKRPSRLFFDPTAKIPGHQRRKSKNRTRATQPTKPRHGQPRPSQGPARTRPRPSQGDSYEAEPGIFRPTGKNCRPTAEGRKIEFVHPGKQSQDAANRGPAKAQLKPNRWPA